MAKSLKVDLLIIDPQNDFMGEDDGTPYAVKMDDGSVLTASLPVKGARSDMKRLGAMIDRVGHKLNDIHVTLDSHRTIDVAHPAMWRDQNGRPPSPFTIIRADDIANSIWTPRDPGLRGRMYNYAKALEAGGNYLLIIWPTHCVIGTWGHNIEVNLVKALHRWEEREFATVDFVTKGSNPFTEHYGGLMAEVVDPTDPSTQLNTTMLSILQDADIIGVAGEALSHCVLRTVTQVADNIGTDHVKKFHLFTDCMSPVPAAPGTPDFPAIGQQFLRDMAARGMTLTTSDQFLA